MEQAARQQTSGALLPIITKEVRSQVSVGVKGEQQNIQQTLLKEVHSSVDELKPTINQRVDQTVSQAVNTSVSKQVDTQIAPRLRQLEDNAQLSSLINQAQAGDGAAYDKLFAIASGQQGPVIQPVAYEVVESIITRHSTPIRTPRQFLSPKSEAEEVKLLNDPETFTRQAAVDSLATPYWEKHLDQLFAIMTTDRSLDVRSDAYFVFSAITKFKADPLNNFAASTWWADHRKDLVK